MADEEQLRILKLSVEAWNDWRKQTLVALAVCDAQRTCGLTNKRHLLEELPDDLRIRDYPDATGADA